MKMLNYITCVSLLLATTISRGQSPVKADQLYAQKAYVNAVKIYEQLISKGSEDLGVRQRLADAYYVSGDYQKALPHYQELVEKSAVTPLTLFRTAQCYLANGQKGLADSLMQQYTTSMSLDQGQQVVISDYYDPQWVLEPVKGLNTSDSEYASSFDTSGLWVSSNRNGAKRTDLWTAAPYQTLYQWSAETLKAALPKQGIDLHEGGALLSKDGQKLYVTLNEITKKASLRDDGTKTLKIYQFDKQGTGWVKGAMTSFSSDDFNTAHPVYSPDGKRIYFSSDRPGGYGQSDLYYVAVGADGTFGDPVNLGPEINTLGRESFPQFNADGVLFFASDGRPGMGGLDLFAVDIHQNQPQVLHLGTTINSSSDDFGLIYSASNQGYVTSKRAGSDDIYTFTHGPLSFVPVQRIKGRVMSEKGPIDGVQIAASLPAGPGMLSDHLGLYGTSALKLTQANTLLFTHPMYKSLELPLPQASGWTTIDLGDIYLKPFISGLNVGDDLGAFFEIDQIYFDFDESKIRKQSEADLALIAEVMITYPQISIEVRSHTDLYGGKKYNQKLSDRRAKATYEYLVGLGVPKERMIYKGYGKSMPVLDCVSCDKDTQIKNRRSEFIVTKNSDN
jgi:outer membrane protein OmpA-like peptidoglycan-associated protein